MLAYVTEDLSAVADADNRLIAETEENQLAASIDALASLRFSIVLTGRFADSPSQPPERRAELRERLAALRRQYSTKIDEIAMTLSVQAAMDAKEKVEKAVAVPRGTGRERLADGPGIDFGI